MDEEKPTETLLDKRAIRQRKQREYYAPTGGPGGAARVRSNSRRRALTARSSSSARSPRCNPLQTKYVVPNPHSFTGYSNGRQGR